MFLLYLQLVVQFFVIPYHNKYYNKYNKDIVTKIVMNLLKLHYIIVTSRPTLFNTKKICKNCEHFIARNQKCGKFGETNLVTGKDEFDYASIARKDQDKCGEDAEHFEKKSSKIEKYLTIFQ